MLRQPEESVVCEVDVIQDEEEDEVLFLGEVRGAEGCERRVSQEEMERVLRIIKGEEEEEEDEQEAGSGSRWRGGGDYGF